MSTKNPYGFFLGAKESIKRTAKIAKKVIAEGDFLVSAPCGNNVSQA